MERRKFFLCIGSVAPIILLFAGCLAYMAPPYLNIYEPEAYKGPAEGEPASLVKVAIAFNGERAKALAGPGGSGEIVEMNLYLTDQKKRYHVVRKTFPGPLAGKTGKVDAAEFRIHPETTVTLLLVTGIYRQSGEKGGAGDGQGRVRDARGCAANVTITPVKDAAYLLDFSNMLVGRDCSLETYEEQSQRDGTVKRKMIPEPGVFVDN